MDPALALSQERDCTAVEQNTWSHTVSTCNPYLSHLPSIEKVFHDKQIQLLLCVVLRVLVPNSIHPKDFSQCCGFLVRRYWVRSLCAGNQSYEKCHYPDCALHLRSSSRIPTFHLENTLL